MVGDRKITDLIAKLVAKTDLRIEDLRGCSVDEINDLESQLNVQLPDIYRAFLQQVGHSWQVLFNDTHVGFEHVVENQKNGREVFEINEIPLPNEPFFVFSERDLERVAFFPLDGKDDPEVSGYTEGDQVVPMGQLSSLLDGAVESAILRFKERGTAKW